MMNTSEVKIWLVDCEQEAHWLKFLVNFAQEKYMADVLPIGLCWVEPTSVPKKHQKPHHRRHQVQGNEHAVNCSELDEVVRFAVNGGVNAEVAFASKRNTVKRLQLFQRHGGHEQVGKQQQAVRQGAGAFACCLRRWRRQYFQEMVQDENKPNSDWGGTPQVHTRHVVRVLEEAIEGQETERKERQDAHHSLKRLRERNVHVPRNTLDDLCKKRRMKKIRGKKEDKIYIYKERERERETSEKKGTQTGQTCWLMIFLPGSCSKVPESFHCQSAAGSQ
jgi:hypothetical protein